MSAELVANIFFLWTHHKALPCPESGEIQIGIWTDVRTKCNVSDASVIIQCSPLMNLYRC
jgi:hypothetical protein